MNWDKLCVTLLQLIPVISADPLSLGLDQTIECSCRSMVRRFPLSPTRFRTLRHLSRSGPLRKYLSSTEPSRSFLLTDRSYPNDIRRQSRSRSHLSHGTTRLQPIVRSASFLGRNNDFPTIDSDLTNSQEVGGICCGEVRSKG